MTEKADIARIEEKVDGIRNTMLRIETDMKEDRAEQKRLREKDCEEVSAIKNDVLVIKTSLDTTGRNFKFVWTALVALVGGLVKAIFFSNGG